jgi:putative transposase
LKLKAMMRGLLPHYATTCAPSDPFWQAKYYSFNLYSETKASEKLDYMHLNPVKPALLNALLNGNRVLHGTINWASASACR